MIMVLTSSTSPRKVKDNCYRNRRARRARRSVSVELLEDQPVQDEPSETSDGVDGKPGLQVVQVEPALGAVEHPWFYVEQECSYYGVEDSFCPNHFLLKPLFFEAEQLVREKIDSLCYKI